MKRRKHLLISDEVQQSLLFRVTLHWAVFMAANLIAFAIWIRFVDAPLAAGDEQFAAFSRLMVPFVICSLAVVPVFLYDITRLSNQFAGPIRRIRNGLGQYIDSGRFEPISLRQNDFWQLLADDCNRALARRNDELPPGPVADAPVPSYTDQ